MKKLITNVLAIVLVVIITAGASAEPIDVESMSMDELVDLEARIESALLGSILANDTELPLGRYVAGEDIAPGRYVVSAVSDYSSPEVYVKIFNQDNTLVESYTLSPAISCKVSLRDGMVMEIDNNHSYEVRANIHTLAGFLIQSSGYTLNSATAKTSSVGASGTTVSEASDNTVLTYLHDKWDLYKAFVMSGSIIRIENWGRVIADDRHPFEQDHAVLVVNTTDGSTDFKWLDETHTSFSITMSDPENSYFKTPALAVFSLGE